MEPVTTVVLALAAIIGTGALTKIGENITDKLTQHVKNYREFLKRKAPNSNTVKALESGGSIDYCGDGWYWEDGVGFALCL
jgi:hypothetical protein